MLEWSSRVPLIVSAPGLLPEGKRVGAPVSLIDLFPTFAELAHVKVDTEVDGHSLLPLLSGLGKRPRSPRHCRVSWRGHHRAHPHGSVDQYKYIIVNGYPPQLYDLQTDPNETVNAAGDARYSRVEAQLRLGWTGWDGPALKRTVMQNQQDRLIIHSVKGDGVTPNWNYEPVETGRMIRCRISPPTDTNPSSGENLCTAAARCRLFTTSIYNAGDRKVARRCLGIMLRMKTKAASSRRSPRRFAHFQPSEWAHF